MQAAYTDLCCRDRHAFYGLSFNTHQREGGLEELSAGDNISEALISVSVK
jgi:hypothetical protein